MSPKLCLLGCCLYVCPSDCPPVGLSACLPVCVSDCLSTCPLGTHDTFISFCSGSDACQVCFSYVTLSWRRHSWWEVEAKTCRCSSRLLQGYERIKDKSQQGRLGKNTVSDLACALHHWLTCQVLRIYQRAISCIEENPNHVCHPSKRMK